MYLNLILLMVWSLMSVGIYERSIYGRIVRHTGYKTDKDIETFDDLTPGFNASMKGKPKTFQPGTLKCRKV